jgi:hypothetical protein
MLRPRLAHEGPHVDEARREDMAAAVDGFGAADRRGRGFPQDIGDEAVADEQAAALVPPGGGIDEASVGEDEVHEEIAVRIAAMNI